MQAIDHLLRPIEIKDKPVFDRYLKQFPQQLSDYSFTNLACWKCRGNTWAEHEGHLFISFIDGDERVYMPPVGPKTEDIMRSMPNVHWSRLNETIAHQMPPQLPAHVLCHKADYVYSVKELIELAGKKYDGKRNFIRRVEKENPVVKALDASSSDACFGLYETWYQNFEHKTRTLEEERSAFKIALDHYAELDLRGIGVWIGGNLKAYAIGDQLSDAMTVEIFEKATTDVTGMYQYVLHAYAKSLDPSVTLLNREEDLNIASLRKAKESWYPIELLQKYEVTAKE
ncbi:MAG TPA: phosphatidylglycerol lysyltransferase domain-containing protein [Candidatus Peribacteraceae bacterium]|nr:phosphatidylglycerol lysyltransferase domain-containing protein [Candidatus Peribacteraceae bacterium]